MKKIGIMGGSFNPIHIGHLNLATEIMEAHHLSEVWFCPAEINPHKTHQPPISSQHRLKMISLAIEHQPRFVICELELRRQAPSYTLDTIKELIALQQNADISLSFSLILGEDTAREFHKWHMPEAIVDLVPLLVGSRISNLNHHPFQGSPKVVNAINEGLTKTRTMEISSSEVRDRLYTKKYCGHLVTGKVLDYIIANDLYYSLLNEPRFL